jgi:hypothetical protein
MGAKSHLTALSDTGVVDDDARGRLEKLGVTTVEELVGHLESQPEGVKEVLEMSSPQLEELHTAAKAALPESTRQAMDDLPPDVHGYGALRPRSDT